MTHLDKKNSNPSYNIMIVGSLALLGAILLNFEEAARLINFGAFFAFMGVNLAVIWSYFIKPPEDYKRLIFKDLILPTIGFLFCFVIWLGLPVISKIIGAVWLTIGIIYSAVKTNGFRNRPILFDFENNLTMLN